MLKGGKPAELNESLAGEYIQRINKVIDYIEQNQGKALTIEELSEVANFSSFHFQRIFASAVGESLGRFVQRLNIERAATLLVRMPKLSVTEIALACGFASSATFARAFRDYYKTSATQWRKEALSGKSTISKTESMIGKTIGRISKEFEMDSIYIGTSPFKQIWRIQMKNNSQIKTEVRVEERPEVHVAYIRNIGPYKNNVELFSSLIGSLCKWAGPRGLLQFPETKMLTIYHDNPEIVAEEKLRISVCVTVPADTPVEGEIGKMVIPAGKYAIAPFEINADQYQDAWDAVYGGWLPQSGYQPDDGPCFELYLNDPNQHPERKHIFEIFVPVKPL